MEKLEVGMKVKNASIDAAGRVLWVDLKHPEDGSRQVIIAYQYNYRGIGERLAITTCDDKSWQTVTPWDDFKIDDPVMVRNECNDPSWHCRYFAGVGNNRPLTFAGSATSWSNEVAFTVGWDECRRPTAEELRRG